MKKVRVMHCLGKLNTGGAETLVVNVLRHINREEFQFDFLLFDSSPGFYDEEVKELGSNLYYVPSMTTAGLKQYIKQMVEFFKSQEIDVVHSHMDWQSGFIAYAAHKAGIKIIIAHSHANQKMFDKDLSHHLLISLNKHLIKKHATHCVACSKEAGDSLFNKGFEVIFNGIDFNKFMYPNQNIINDLQKEYDIKEYDIVLGNVGSLSPNKNQAFLIRVLSGLQRYNSNYRLILVGDGASKEELIELANSLGLQNKVTFAGVRSEIPEIMSLFDMFLFPSFKEGLGIVGIEAQASGLQCIASDTIPKSMDLGIDKVTFIPLNEELWCNTIKSMENEHTFLENEMITSEYSIVDTCKKLEEIYK